MLLISSLVIISLLTFYSAPGDPPSQFAVIFAIAGAIYGLLTGLIAGHSDRWLVAFWARRSLRALRLRSGRDWVRIGPARIPLVGQRWRPGHRPYPISRARYSHPRLSGGRLPGNRLTAGWLLSRQPSRQHFKLRPIALITLAVVAILLLFSLSAATPFLDRLSAVLAPRSAGLSSTLASDAAGTHWSDPVTVASGTVAGTEGGPVQTALAATGEHVALVWNQNTGGSSAITYRPGSWNADIQSTEWLSPLTIDQSVGEKSNPQVALDKDGAAHIVWRDHSVVFYSRCQLDECTEPAALSEELLPNCDLAPTSTLDISQQSPAVAVSQDNRLMVVWHGPDGTLRYTSSPASLTPGTGANDCVPAGEASSATQLKLAGGLDSQFSLVFAHNRPGSEILALNYDGNAWGTERTIDWQRSLTASADGRAGAATFRLVRRR